jgi:hypothetical protein
LLGAEKVFLAAAAKSPTAKTKNFNCRNSMRRKIRCGQSRRQCRRLNKVSLPAAATTQKIPVIATARTGCTSWKRDGCRSVRPRRAQPAVKATQAELSLESVKVVHNDLADADMKHAGEVANNSQPEAPVSPPAAAVRGNFSANGWCSKVDFI